MTYKEMLDKLRELENRIRALEQKHITFGPQFTPGTLPQPMMPQPTYTLGCRVCGLGSDGPMGYACPRSDCPSAVRCVGDMK